MKIDDSSIYDVFSSAWLDGVSHDPLRELRQISDVVQFEHNSVIYSLGGPQEWLWGIASGRVQVRVAMMEMEMVLGHVHHPGAWFGESELANKLDGLVEMKAVGTTVVSRVPYKRFRAIANRHPELWEAFARLTSMNQLLAMSAANDLALRTSRKRLAATLLRLSGRRGVRQGSWHSNVVHASQQDIAHLANVSLSKTSLHLGELANEGLVLLYYGRIEINEPDKLTTIVQA